MSNCGGEYNLLTVQSKHLQILLIVQSKHLQILLTCPYIPYSNTLVKTPGNYKITLWVEIATKHVVTVSLQGLQTFARTQLPHLETRIKSCDFQIYFFNSMYLIEYNFFSVVLSFYPRSVFLK